MAQDTFDIEEQMNEAETEQSQSYLFVDPAEAQISPAVKEMEIVDNIVDAASMDNYNVFSASAAVNETYNKLGPEQAAEAYTSDRVASMWDAYDEAQRQAIESSVSIPDAANVIRSLQTDQKRVDEIKEKPWAHEAGIELVSRGVVENAPKVFAGRHIAGMTEDSGLMETLGDWVGIFLWPDQPKDQADFAQLVTGKYTFIPQGDDEMKRVINAWSLLSPEYQRAIFPEFVDMALEATEGNKEKAKILLSPFAATFSDSEVDFNTTLGLIDWVLVGAWPATTLYKAAKTANTVNRIVRLKGKKDAATVTNKVLGDPTDAMADALHIPKVTAGANAHPVNQSKVIFDSTDDLAGSIADEVAEIENGLARVRDSLHEIEANEWLQVKLLSEDEMIEFANSQRKSLETWAEGYYRGRGFVVENAEVFNRTKDGFQVRLNMRNSATGAVDNIESPVLSYTLDGVPKATQNIKANPVTSYLASPSIWIKAALQEGLVQEATVINFQQMRLNRLFNDSLKEVWSGLSKQQKKKVDAVLWQGQKEVGENAGRSTDMGRVYTWNELDKGVDVAGEVISLNKAEKEAYFKARELFDASHRMLNRMQRESLKSNGFMEATVMGQTRILQPFRQSSDVPSSSINGAAYNPKTGQAGKITRATIDKMYADGWVLTKLHDSSYISGTVNGSKSQISHAWTKPGNLKELRANPIRYVEGYVPRIYKNAPFVVEKRVVTKVDGRNVPSTNIVRLFKTRKEAKAYAASQMAKSKRGTVYTARHQSEMDAPTTREMILQEAGGLFVDDKGKHLKLGLDGNNLAETYNASEALNRQLAYLAKNMPMNLWRQSVIRRWENAAEKAASHNPSLLREVKKAGFNVRLDMFGDKNVQKALERSREWIRDQLLLASPQERAWQGTMLRLADWSEGLPVGTSAQKAFLWAGDKDPFSALRAASFHALLGIWNPAQLIVQAQGFAVAAALDGLSPVQIGNRMRQYMALRALGNTREVNDAVIKAAAKAGGFSEKEMRAIHNEFRISGLLDSVRTNADLEMMKNGFPTDRGAWGRILNSNLFFYREGEMFTRSYAFLVARDAYLARPENVARGLSRSSALEGDDLLNVVELTTKKMLNLNRANRAQWQKGVLSVPTQFFQVTAKFMEQFTPGLKSGFTASQKSKVIASQLALYGAAGLPFGTLAVEKLLEAMGVGPEDMNEEVVSQIRNGIGGLLSELMFDESISIGKRGAYISGLEQLIRDILKDQVSVATIASGAAGHVLDRTYQAVSAIAPLIVNPDVKLTANEAEIAVGELASIFSTFSNAHKAYLWWKWQQIVNKRGQVVMNAEEADNFGAVVLFKALGFNTQSIEDVYEADEFSRNFTKYKGEVKNGLKEISTQYLWKYSRGEIGEKEYRNMEAKWNMLLMGYPEHLRDEIMSEAWDEMFNGDTKLDKNFQKAFQTYLETGDTQFGMRGIGLNSSILKENE